VNVAQLVFKLSIGCGFGCVCVAVKSDEEPTSATKRWGKDGNLLANDLLKIL
jgi:hypothetical protein